MRPIEDPTRLAIERHRLTTGPSASSVADGNNGTFVIDRGARGSLMIEISDKGGWDRVSITLIESRTEPYPTHTECKYVRGMFFADDETPIQFYPAKETPGASISINLWRKHEAIVLPPAIAV